MSLLGKPSLKETFLVNSPPNYLFFSCWFPHPTKSICMEELVFKKVKKEKVWTENDHQLFFEIKPSISISPFVLSLFSCLIFGLKFPSFRSVLLPVTVLLNEVLYRIIVVNFNIPKRNGDD